MLPGSADLNLVHPAPPAPSVTILKVYKKLLKGEKKIRSFVDQESNSMAQPEIQTSNGF